MSPSRPLGPCLTPGCPGRAGHGGRCARHAHQPARHGSSEPARSSAALGYGYAWQQLRARVLQDCPVCVGCGQAATDVDHIVPRRLGGSDDRDNLQPLCRSCHARKRAREGVLIRAAPRLPSMSPMFEVRERDPERRALSRVIHVCGQPATGKTLLLQELDAGLGLATFSIDEERLEQGAMGQGWSGQQGVLAWVKLEDHVDAYRVCAVETSGRHPHDVLLLQGRAVFRIVCTASEAVRRARLEQRRREGYQLVGGQADYVQRLLSLPAPSLPADATLDSTDPEACTAQLASVLRLAETFLADGSR